MFVTPYNILNEETCMRHIREGVRKAIEEVKPKRLKEGVWFIAHNKDMQEKSIMVEKDTFYEEELIEMSGELGKEFWRMGYIISHISWLEVEKDSFYIEMVYPPDIVHAVCMPIIRHEGYMSLGDAIDVIPSHTTTLQECLKGALMV